MQAHRPGVQEILIPRPPPNFPFAQKANSSKVYRRKQGDGVVTYSEPLSRNAKEMRRFLGEPIK